MTEKMGQHFSSSSRLPLYGLMREAGPAASVKELSAEPDHGRSLRAMVIPWLNQLNPRPQRYTGQSEVEDGLFRLSLTSKWVAQTA